MAYTRLKTKQDLAILGTGPIPADAYRSATYFEAEREAVFRRSWLLIGRVEEIARPGSFIVREVDICDASILIARGQDGTLRAFHNVCAHRGSTLVLERQGRVPVFACRYHQWTYNLDGSLRGVPDERNFYDLDREACRLTPVAIDTHAGFLFIALTPPALPLREYLGGMGNLLDTHDFSACTEFAEFENIVDANWKIAFDNFQETYHVTSIHRKSIVKLMTGPENPYGDPLGYAFLGPHRHMPLWANFDYTPAPLEAVSFRYSTVIKKQSAEAPPPDGPTSLDVHAVFPNVFINVGSGTYFTHQFWPLTPSRTRVVARIHFAPARSAGERFAQEHAIASVRDVMAEDMDMIVASNRGVRSGAREYFHFHAQEAACRHQFNEVDARVAGWRAETTQARTP